MNEQDINSKIDGKIDAAIAELEQAHILKIMRLQWLVFMRTNARELRRCGIAGQDFREAMLQTREECQINLYLFFSEDGDLNHWTIDHAQYFAGSSSLVATVPIETTTLDEVRRAIEDDIGTELFEHFEHFEHEEV